MATRRKEIDREELMGLVRDVLRQADPEMLTLEEVREALADEERYAVQASPEELATLLNELLVAREIELRAGDTGVLAFARARRPVSGRDR